MATIQAGGDGFFAQAARFLSEVTLSDGESVQLYLAMLAVASVSVFPGALLGTNLSGDFYPSATLSRLKLVSKTFLQTRL